jgi:hypothetical protein
MMSISSMIMKIIIILMFFYFPFPLFQILIWLLVKNGFFDFLHSWPLVLSCLFFLFLTVLMLEFSNILRVLIFIFNFQEKTLCAAVSATGVYLRDAEGRA